MKQEFLMMALLIPRHCAPGKDINIYLQSLIDELKELCEKSVQTFDVTVRNYFTIRAIVLWTINDFPSYGTVSGYRTQGYKACPICEEDTSSFRIRGKTCYMGHHRYLCPDHKWRNNKEYDSRIKRRSPPIMFSGDNILPKLEKLWKCRLGKWQSC